MLGFLLIGMPLLQHHRILGQMLPSIAYFFAIGLAFMLAEMALLEQLTPFLGKPIYALAVVLSGLLLASGLGAGWGQTQEFRSVIKTFGGLLGLLLLYFLGLGNVLSAWAGLETIPRLLVALAAVALPGFLMGVPFPVGLTRLVEGIPDSEQRRIRVALAWCCNGCASVMGATGAIWLAQLSGQSTLFLAATLSYVFALLMLKKL